SPTGECCDICLPVEVAKVPSTSAAQRSDTGKTGCLNIFFNVVKICTDIILFTQEQKIFIKTPVYFFLITDFQHILISCIDIPDSHLWEKIIVFKDSTAFKTICNLFSA